MVMKHLEFDYQDLVDRNNYVNLLVNYLIYQGIERPKCGIYRNDYLSVTLRTALYAIEYEKLTSINSQFDPRYNHADVSFETFVYELTDYKKILNKINCFLNESKINGCLALFNREEEEYLNYLDKTAKLLNRKNNASKLVMMYDSLYSAFKSLDELFDSFSHETEVSKAIEKYMLSDELKIANKNLKILSPADHFILHQLIQKKIGNFLFKGQNWRKNHDKNIRFLS